MGQQWRRRWQRRDRRARRGQGLVEMAILLPVFALILVGALDLGRVYIYQTRVHNAIKEAAITGLYQPDLLAVKKRAFREVTDPGVLSSSSDDVYLLGVPDVDFVIESMNCYKAATPTTIMSSCSANPAPGDFIEVTGHFNFHPITSEIIRLFPSPIVIRTSVKVVY